MTTILVTGDKGFIGSRVLEKVVGIPFSKYADDITSNWVAAVPRADVVVHCAGATEAKKSRVNIDGTQRVLEYCRLHNARLIFLSTNVYGDPDSLPVCEDAPIKPANAYTRSKREAEQLIQQSGVSGFILRLANVFGPGQKLGMLIPNLLAGDASVSSLDARRDYLYIDDAVAAIVLAIRHATSELHTLNIGSGTSRSTLEVIKELSKYRKLAFKESPDDAGINEIFYDCTRAKQLLGWEPRVSFEEGVRLLFQKER